jgi:hypothetical protein
MLTKHQSRDALLILLLMYAPNKPPLAPPLIVDSDGNEHKDSKVDNDNKPPTADKDKGHKDTAATTNETKTMVPKATTKTPVATTAKKPISPRQPARPMQTTIQPPLREG